MICTRVPLNGSASLEWTQVNQMVVRTDGDTQTYSEKVAGIGRLGEIAD